MARVTAVALASSVVVALGSAGCGSGDGVGVRLVSKEVRQGETPKVAVGVFVTASCFFSVLLNGNLKASGRWSGGNHEVLIPGYLMAPADNVIAIDVAGKDGSSASLEEPLTFCEAGAIACGDVLPDAGPEPGEDAGVPDDVLCAPCDGPGADDQCGGQPNECVFLFPPNPGVCGTFCGDDYRCPPGYLCTTFQDETHTSLLCFHPGPDFICP